jgi:NAD(P)H-dependent FMN reductase
MSDIKVLVLVGSLRAASVNRQLAELATETAPDGVTLTLFDGLGELPFYNEDIDNEEVPASVVALRRAAADADAALVVTPEYNGSIPGVLKNAIDWLSRPFGNSALKGKPMAVVGAALGQYGGVWAHDETRKSFGIAGPRVVEDLKLSVPAKSFDGKHPRENAEVAAKLRDIVGKLAAEVG